MTFHYFVLIDKGDSEKFRMFKLSKFNKKTNQILTKYRSKSIWSFHKGQVKKSIWTKISKNDFVYFAIPQDNFIIVGHVSQKIIDEKLGRIMWPNSIIAEQITHFLLFDRLESVSVFYHEMTSNAKSKLHVPIPGIYEIRKEFYNRLQVQVTSTRKPKTFRLSKSIEKIPKTDVCEINRFLRDSSSVSKLKALYDNKCQICGFTFEYDKAKFYSEVHHYNPLGEGGDDAMDNMIVVCPNHHSQFDYKMIAINMDGENIIDRQGNQIAQIHFKSTHHLSEKNLLSQLEAV